MNRSLWLSMALALGLLGCSSGDGDDDGMVVLPMPGGPTTGMPSLPGDGAPPPATGDTGMAGSPAMDDGQQPPAPGSDDMAPSGGEMPGTMQPPAGGSAPPPRDYFPTDGWQSKAPAELGVDEATLGVAFDYVQETATQALLVIHGGYIVREEYYRGFSAEQRHESFSMAKSFTSGLVGIAIGAGLLPDVDAPLCDYYDAWDCADTGDTRSRITLAHAMTLTTGLDWQEDWSAGLLAPNDAITMSSSPRPIDYVLAKGGAHEPGTHFQYSTGDPALLSGVLQSVTGKSALAYAQEQIFQTIGIPGVQWNDDADGQTTTYAGLSATAREFAKYGFLFLNQGNWDGTQVVPAEWVAESTTSQSLEDWYGYLWHVNAPSKWNDPTLPADGYAAIGVQGQHIIIIPSRDLLIVRLAEDGFGASSFDAGVLINHVLAALP